MSVELWGAAAAKALGYPPLGRAWAARAVDRLTPELLADLTLGVDEGALAVDGYQFALPRLRLVHRATHGAMKALEDRRQVLRRPCNSQLGVLAPGAFHVFLLASPAP